jgi:hypothetical protein
MQTSDAAVPQVGEHREPELRALTTVTGPQPEDVAFAVHRDRHDDVDRPVGDAARRGSSLAARR